jgi:beta-glucanase (GH16 family)
MRSLFLVAILMSIHAFQPTTEKAEADPRIAADEWTLVWSDEFQDDGPPNPKNWTYEHGFVRNSEYQWYQPENATCRNGLLIIEARKERKLNSFYAAYTSSSLTTQGLHAWRFGRFEMRGRIDTRAGLWPAFWTLGVKRNWPGNGEIDIMEYYRGILLANAAWGTNKKNVARWDDSRKPIASFLDADWSNQFHIWRMDWDSNRIEIYVDDMLLNEVDLNKTFNEDREKKNPFREPHYLLLNLAIGGTSGGDPSNTQFPARFEVDYVRVYQKANAR